MFIISVTGGGKQINTTNYVRFERVTKGGLRNTTEDTPTKEDPGPYGFGRSGNDIVDDQINLTKERILNARNFREFALSYSGSSTEEILMAGRFIGAFLQQVAYHNDAKDALDNTDFFSPSVQQIANTTNEDIFGYLKQYVEWYSTHSTNDPLPEHLKDGIGVCTHIHNTMAEFYNKNGIPTVVASVSTPGGPHVVAISLLPESTRLTNYGSVFMTEKDSFQEMIRFFGRQQGTPTLQAQLFVPEDDGSLRYLGTLETPAGKAAHNAFGIINKRKLKIEFLNIKEF
jgi:hypothetical protein